MALTKRGMRRTASQAANEGYQYRKNRQLQEEPINKKPEKEYFKKKKNSQVTYNY
jgi:hypothetical protein